MPLSMWQCITTWGPGSGLYMHIKQPLSLQTTDSPPSHAQVYPAQLLAALSRLCHAGAHASDHLPASRLCADGKACHRHNQSIMLSSPEASAATLQLRHVASVEVVVYAREQCLAHSQSTAHVLQMRQQLGRKSAGECAHMTLATCMGFRLMCEQPQCCTCDQKCKCSRHHNVI